MLYIALTPCSTDVYVSVIIKFWKFVAAHVAIPSCLVADFSCGYSATCTLYLLFKVFVMRICAGPVTQTNYDIKCFIKL